LRLHNAGITAKPRIKARRQINGKNGASVAKLIICVMVWMIAAIHSSPGQNTRQRPGISINDIGNYWQP
jgi:hypothetical protein